MFRNLIFKLNPVVILLVLIFVIPNMHSYWPLMIMVMGVPALAVQGIVSYLGITFGSNKIIYIICTILSLAMLILTGIFILDK